MNIGILGGGQLGRMLALAGYPLGFRFRCFDPSPEAVAGHVMPLTVGSFEDLDALTAFATGLDLVTFEFENVPVWSAECLAQKVPLYPSPMALAMSQDRVEEKTFFQSMNIPTAPFAPVNSRTDFETALQNLGLPAVLKTCRLGYDGKGQYVLQTVADIEPAWSKLQGVPLILEGFVAFEREVSILAARSTRGETVFYPLVENKHTGGILQSSRVTAPASTSELQRLAQNYALKTMEALEYTGVLAIEFFQCGKELIVNEMAPRVHNSGHWSIEGACTSQFANHLRATTGLPLGSTKVTNHVGMKNILGQIPSLEKLLAQATDQVQLYVHLYGKKPLPGRKLGHITMLSKDAGSLESVMTTDWTELS
ncbi:MAG TPA: 5-(carboxyamino)imidazole ribonucleotide synthase [Gemmatales bacterium]|nr:5-(carboxyamino)imidazole ribonucleotide synthase [Gemmatales bacterium]HMP17938.1 5-(carboxyamino)imidazole ribonucleotide synthase [Gemmatales bacterium]